jgi:hypothetical protein
MAFPGRRSQPTSEPRGGRPSGCPCQSARWSEEGNQPALFTTRLRRASAGGRDRMRFNASATTAFSGTAAVGRTGRVAENCWPCPSQLRSRRVTIGSAANTSPDTTLYRARHARAAIGRSGTPQTSHRLHSNAISDLPARTGRLPAAKTSRSSTSFHPSTAPTLLFPLSTSHLPPFKTHSLRAVPAA